MVQVTVLNVLIVKRLKSNFTVESGLAKITCRTRTDTVGQLQDPSATTAKQSLTIESVLKHTEARARARAFYTAAKRWKVFSVDPTMDRSVKIVNPS